LQEVPQNAALPGALTSTESIAGLAASTWIYAGEQILPDKFGADTASSVLQIPDKLNGTAVQLTDPARVAGFVTPGSEVAVFWTRPRDEAGPSYTRILLDRVTVLGVGSVTPVSTTTTDETGAETTEEIPTALLTLALDQDQATRVIYAASNGEVYFSLLTNDSETSTPAGPVDEQNLFE
jgi:pilus assembly protein CpaB